MYSTASYYGGSNTISDSRTYSVSVTNWTVQNYEVVNRANVNGFPSNHVWGDYIFYVGAANSFGVTGVVNQSYSQLTCTYSYYTGWDGGYQRTLATQIHRLDLRSSTISTTGTLYLTRSSTSATSYLTRSSTSRTEYKTRESTSGYSGISSSSSQSSGWL